MAGDEEEAPILVAACVHCCLSMNETDFSSSVQSAEPQAVAVLPVKTQL